MRTCSVPFLGVASTLLATRLEINLAYLPADPINVAGASVLALDVNGVVSELEAVEVQDLIENFGQPHRSWFAGTLFVKAEGLLRDMRNQLQFTLRKVEVRTQLAWQPRVVAHQGRANSLPPPEDC